MSGYVVLRNRELNDMLRSQNGAVGRAMVRHGQKVLNRAKTLCPVDTGRLRGSIAMEVGIEGDEVTVRVGTNVEYARYVHDGTRYIEPNPFLADALLSVPWALGQEFG